MKKTPFYFAFTRIMGFYFLNGGMFMTIVQIGKFGKNKRGVHTFSVSATDKEDIYKIISQARGMGWRFFQTPNVTKSFKTYHVLLELYRR